MSNTLDQNAIKRIEQRIKDRDLTESEMNKRMSNWSRKMFGYTKNGKYYRDK